MPSPQPRLVEYFPVLTCGPPQDLPARLAAVPAHPGAFTAFGVCPNRQGRDIHLDP
jgi:hypothetical protein